MMPTRTLVTGFRGQLGRRLVSEILKSHPDYSLIGLDLPRNGGEAQIDFVECDLASESELARVSDRLADVQVLVHLAARIDGSRDLLRDGIPSIDQNIRVPLNLLSVLPRLERIVFTSSYMVYGNGRAHAIREADATNPLNLYGASKLATEKYLKIYSAARNIPVTTLRLAGVYGPGTPPDGQRSISTFIRSVAAGKAPPLWGNVHAKRNYLYIDDCIAALIQSMAARTGGVYNVAGSDGVSVLDMLEILQRLFGVDLKLSPQESVVDCSSNFVLDCAKILSEQGYRPKVSFPEGLRRQIYDSQEYGARLR